MHVLFSRLMLCALLVYAVVGCVQPTSARTDGARAIPDDNLAYPVLITLGNSTGSGFYVNNGKDIFLVTAKHVLVDQKNSTYFDRHLSLLSYSKDPKDDTTNLVNADLEILRSNGDIRLHPTSDIAVVRLFKLAYTAEHPAGIVSVAGVQQVKSAKTGISGADLPALRSFQDVLVGNDVMLFGYPVSIGLKDTPQFDDHRPLLRKGIVAGVDPAKRVIVLDCPSYWGNSGGPVLEIDRQGLQTNLSIIGVLDQFVPFVDAAKTIGLTTNSGYSVALPIDLVLELVK